MKSVMKEKERRKSIRTVVNGPEKPMPVIHGSINMDGTFFIWGEGQWMPALKKRGRKPAQRKPAPHPYALPHASLKSILIKDLLWTETIIEASTCLLLPTSEQGPEPSPELSHDWDRTTLHKPILAPWTVPVISVPIAQVLPLLLSARGDNKEARFGRTIAAWSVAALFACELVVSGSFAPVFLRAGKGIVTGGWRPELNDENKKRLSELAAAMPPAIRAHIEPGTPTDSPLLLVGQFIDAAIQVLISLATSRSYPPVPARQPAHPQSTEELWYRSLIGEKHHITANSPAVKELTIWLAGRDHARGEGRFTTCFTVQEPDSEESVWTVNFFLQSKDDPTLLVPAGDVWNGRSPSLAWLTNGKTGHPQEQMLYDLGAAAKVYPPIRDALKKGSS